MVRMQRTAAVEDLRACSQSLSSAMVEISEAADKFTDCSARIQSGMAQVNSLLAKLSMCNSRSAATSAEQSVNVLQSSAQSCSRLRDSVSTAMWEVEQLKVEHMQLCRRCDRLLEIFHECARRTDENDEVTVQLQQQNDATDAEAETSMIYVPYTSRLDADQNVIVEAGDGSSAVIDSSATATEPGPTNPAESAMVTSNALDTVVSESAMYRASLPRNRRGRGSKSATVRWVKPTVIYSSDRATLSNHGVVNGTFPAQPIISAVHEVVPTVAEVRSSRGRARGRGRAKPDDVAIRARSADTFSRTNTVKPRRGRSNKSSAQNHDVVNNTGMLNLDNGDNAVDSNAVNDSVQFAAVVDFSVMAESGKSSVVKPHGSRRRTRSAVSFSEQTFFGGQLDGHAVSGEDLSSHQQPRIAAGVDSVDATKSARPRSCIPPVQPNPRRRKNINNPAEVVQCPPCATTTSDMFPSTAATACSSPAHRPVTTYLSGLRTDIFRQYPKQAASSSVNTFNGILPSISTVDEEDSFVTTTGHVNPVSVPVTAARYATSADLAR